MDRNKTTNKKVPGQVLPIGKLGDEAKKFAKEIKQMKIPELKSTLNRQNALLSNHKLITSLPDKGEKVRQRQQQLEVLIETRERNAVDSTSDLLHAMSITCGSKRIDTDKMEWHLGGANLINQYNNTHILDSDDESDKDVDPEEYIENNPDFQKNPLKILASRSEVASHKKKQNTYATSLAEIIDTQTDKTKRDLDSRFVPFKSLRHETLPEEEKSTIEKSLVRNKLQSGNRIELMPLPSNKYSKLKAKSVKMEESILLQKEQEQKLKEIQSKHAAERLAACSSNGLIGGIGSLSSSKKMEYREPQFDNDNELEDNNKCTFSEHVNNEDSCDESETEGGVTVHFTQEELEPPT